MKNVFPAMAKDLGLVDELGGIDKALNAAATQAGIENYSIIAVSYTHLRLVLLVCLS